MATSNYMDINDGETNNEYILRIGDLKTAGITSATWTELAAIMNEQMGTSYDKSTIAKKYRELSAKVEREAPERPDSQTNTITKTMMDMEKNRIKTRDDMAWYRSELRTSARREDFLTLFESAIEKYGATPPALPDAVKDSKNGKAVVAMLSDLHYGIEYDSALGKYSPEIARDRLMHYADQIIDFANIHNAYVCYVALMGDMVSGNIHTTVRVQNRLNLVEQIVGASEVVAEFLRKLADAFNKVYVGSVNGNHSRIDKQMEENMSAEKLDYLVTIYAKTKLTNVHEIVFKPDEYSGTAGAFDIFGHKYAFIHGDMDKRPDSTLERVRRIPGLEDSYCVLAGHMHYGMNKFDSAMYVQNGSVCGSGDDFSVRTRLVSKPCQTCFEVNAQGIGDMRTVML